jgi:3-methyladenine DNA glycosylase AlkD
MTAAEVLAQLETLGTEQTKKTFLRHGAREPFFGVKVGDLKVLQKKIKKDHALALALYDTGNSDAMYLAGLISDPKQMTKAQIQKWLKGAYWHMPAQYTVPWVAAESKFGAELARAWVDSPKELTAVAGWFTWASLVGVTPDEELDLDELAELLDRVQAKIHGARNREKYAMNNFIIAVGAFVEPLLVKAKSVAKAVGTVDVDHGDTSCKTPNALDYLTYVQSKRGIGKKRKSAMC